MNLERTYTIFKDDYGKYKIGISHKTIEGKTEFASFPVRFKKSVELENKTKIQIKKYWLDFFNWEYQGKKGTSWFIFINEYETVGETTEQVKEEVKDPFEEFNNEYSEEIDSLDLPF